MPVSKLLGHRSHQLNMYDFSPLIFNIKILSVRYHALFGWVGGGGGAGGGGRPKGRGLLPVFFIPNTILRTRVYGYSGPIQELRRRRYNKRQDRSPLYFLNKRWLVCVLTILDCCVYRGN